MNNWNIKMVKERALRALGRNYLRLVIAAAVLVLFREAIGMALSYLQVTDMSSESDAYERLLIMSGLLQGPVLFLVTGPLEVGCLRYMLRSFREGKPKMEFQVTKHYWNVVFVQFQRELYTCLWLLVFIIPGIIKGYEYRMVPYILAEKPDMPGQEAFLLSKKMMEGEKMNAFLLDVSFIGWVLLTMMTVSTAGWAFVFPYMEMTGVALYEALRWKVD